MTKSISCFNSHSLKVVKSQFPYIVYIKDISIGTKELSITPFIKDAIATSEDVFFDIIGNVVSIDVAPAGAMAVK